MSGLVGFVSRLPAATADARLDAMLRSALYSRRYTAHRRFDASLQTAFAWTTVGGEERVYSQTQTASMVFAGQDFHPDTRGLGPVCARLLQAYEDVGESFLREINGCFCGIILDKARGKVLLFNDRYGLGRIYVHHNADGLWFATEAKSLLSCFPELRAFDANSLAEYLSTGCVLQNRTLFRGLTLLPAASCWVWTLDKGPEKRTYFEFEEWERAPKLSTQAFQHELNAVFPSVMEPYLAGDERIAMSLTGGLDGRMIMAWAKCPPGSLPCYTFGSPLRDSADVKIARRIADLCGQPHKVIPMDSDFFKDFTQLAEKSVFISDGTMDVTGAAELYVNRSAREIARVRLTGNYGSEILRANVAFKPRVPSTALYTPDFVELCKAAAKTYQNERECSTLSFITRKQLPWHHYGRLSVEQSQLQVRSPFIDNRLVKLAFQAGEAAAFGKEPSFSVIAAGRPELARIPTDRGLTQAHTSRLNPASLMQEFTFKAEYAYDYGMPPWLVKLDNVFRPFKLERLFLGRHKFCHFRSWYRNELGRGIEDYLGAIQDRMPAIYNRGSVSRIAREHTAGHANHTDDITACLTVAMVQSKLLDRQAS